MRLVHALGLASLLAAAQPGPAAKPPGLRGYVLAPDGTPVVNGSVFIRSGISSVTTPLERTGRFRLVPERSGPQELHVVVPGFAPHRIDVDVPPSRTIDLPIIRLSPPTYVRMRPVSATGEVIGSSRIARQSLNLDGSPAIAAVETATDSEGNITLGPLPRGVTMLGLDSPPLALTRLQDLYVSDSGELLDVGTVMVDLGAVLHVDVVDATGAPISAQNVLIEDAKPFGPFLFPVSRTNPQGRATFERLAAGRYRIRTRAAGRCGGQTLFVGRLVSVPGRGTFNIRIVAGGTANLRLSSRFGALAGATVTLTPDSAAPQPPPWLHTPSDNPMSQRLTLGSPPPEPSCFGTTDANGVVALSDFPPGPAHIDVRFPNSRYTQRLTVGETAKEIPVRIPDWLMQASVTDIVTKRPVAGATITWSAGGARVEARTTGSGDALLEAVTATQGTLAVTAAGYKRYERQLSEPPQGNYEVTLTPAPPLMIQARISSGSGEPLAHAVVTLSSERPADIERIAVADGKGVATFLAIGPGTLRLSARADGFATATARIPEDGRDNIALTLSRGYRLLLDLELPTDAGLQLIRVLHQAGASLDDVLDLASERKVEPSGRVSLGPLPPGLYVIELHGSAGRRQTRVQIVDRDVSVAVR